MLGLGDTGLSMTRWLARHGARVSVADTRAAPPHAGVLAVRIPDRCAGNRTRLPHPLPVGPGCRVREAVGADGGVGNFAGDEAASMDAAHDRGSEGA